MKNILILFLFIALMGECCVSQSRSSISGIYNNWELNWQFRIDDDGSLELYTATCATPYYGTWVLKGSNFSISVPDFLKQTIKLKVKKSGFYNDKGKLVWDKAD